MSNIEQNSAREVEGRSSKPARNCCSFSWYRKLWESIGSQQEQDSSSQIEHQANSGSGQRDGSSSQIEHQANSGSGQRDGSSSQIEHQANSGSGQRDGSSSEAGPQPKSRTTAIVNAFCRYVGITPTPETPSAEGNSPNAETPLLSSELSSPTSGTFSHGDPSLSIRPIDELWGEHFESNLNTRR